MKINDVALLKMRTWVEAEIERGRLPYQDPFSLVSISSCVDKALGESERGEILALLQRVAAREPQVGTYDVVTPHQAIFLINAALRVRDSP